MQNSGLDRLGGGLVIWRVGNWQVIVFSRNSSIGTDCQRFLILLKFLHSYFFSAIVTVRSVDWIQNSRKSCRELRLGWGTHHPSLQKQDKQDARRNTFFVKNRFDAVALSNKICRQVGEGMRSDHLTWRHTCVVLDFEEG